MAPMREEPIETDMKPMVSMTLDPTKNEIKLMTPNKDVSTKKEANRGAWTAQEDQKLAEMVAIYGPKKWKTIATKAGLNRCGKSCRLRWLNYLRPNIKRGNISDQEEDLILRLHKLLGNRWSLIAGRLPGRTDNEIKNYWNSHLSKKKFQKEKQIGGSKREGCNTQKQGVVEKANVEVRKEEDSTFNGGESSNINFNVDEFFDFSSEGPLNLEWVSQFLDMDSGLL